jgi:hypothetical protein
MKAGFAKLINKRRSVAETLYGQMLMAEKLLINA